jgi:hypothetical protein
VVKRLFFNRVALHSRGVAPRYLKLAPLIEADFADAQLSFGNSAAMAAGEALHKSPVNLLVEFAFANVGVENILECGHKS